MKFERCNGYVRGEKKYTVWWYFEANSGNEKDVIMNDDVVGREIDRCIFFTYRLNR